MMMPLKFLNEVLNVSCRSSGKRFYCYLPTLLRRPSGQVAKPAKSEIGRTVYQSLKGRDLLSFEGYTRNDIFSLLWVASEIKSTQDQAVSLCTNKRIVLVWNSPIIKASASEASLKLNASLCCIHEDQLLATTNNSEMLGRSFASATDIVLLDAPSWNQTVVEEFAAGCHCPVVTINSQQFSPAMAYTELITLFEKYGFLRRLIFSYIGPGNSPILNTYFLLLPTIGANLRFWVTGLVEDSYSWEQGFKLASRNNTETKQLECMDDLLYRAHIISTCDHDLYQQITLKDVKEMDLEWSYIQYDSFKGLTAAKDFLRAKGHNLISDTISNQSRIFQALVIAHASDFLPTTQPPRFEGVD